MVTSTHESAVDDRDWERRVREARRRGGALRTGRLLAKGVAVGALLLGIAAGAWLRGRSR